MGIESLVQRGLISKADITPAGIDDPLSRDPYAPTYDLIIYGGQGAQPFAITDEVKKFITSIEYEDNADQFDKLTINFENQIDGGGGGNVNSIIDSVLFAEGHTVQVKMGYGHVTETVGAADIVKKQPNWPEGGSPSLTIVCFDGMNRLSRNRPKGGRNFLNSTPTDIAKTIGQANGLVVDAVDALGNPTIQKIGAIYSSKEKKKGAAQKKGMSDYEYLKKVADSYGLDLFVRFDEKLRKFVLYMQQPATINQKQVFTFVYNEDDISYENTLLSFAPDQDSSDQGTDIEVFTLDRTKLNSGTKIDFITRLTVEEQQKLKAETERRFTGGNKTSGKQKALNDGAIVGFKAYGRSFRFPPHKRFTSEEDIVREIELFIKRQKEHFILGSASLRGKEVIQSRQVHIFENVSEQFSGKYFFDKVTHKFDTSNGYKLDLAVRRVIEDDVVQAPPTLSFTDNDKTISKLKGLF